VGLQGRGKKADESDHRKELFNIVESTCSMLMTTFKACYKTTTNH